MPTKAPILVPVTVAMIFMMAIEQDYAMKLIWAIRPFQNTMMRVRYSGIPVVLASWFGIGWRMRNEFARR
ncbi:MAG: hypothetical protein IPL84_03730 [Chitinophagaceae bacterium]|nr:hypothetical protein [Chitinophagaceae bacterium]